MNENSIVRQVSQYELYREVTIITALLISYMYLFTTASTFMIPWTVLSYSSKHQWLELEWFIYCGWFELIFDWVPRNFWLLKKRNIKGYFMNTFLMYVVCIH